jgi:glycosyltransferase involved in cell wall biosynthesis
MSKVLQISIEVNSGSVGKIAEQIGEVVIEQGWKSYITYARNNNPSKSEVIKIGNKFDLYSQVIETRIFDNHCVGSKSSTIALISKIKEIQPDIIHLHHLHGYFINVEILFRYLEESQIPIVWTFHDCWSFTGHCAYFDFVGCEKWKTQCHHCEQKNEYPKSFLFDRSRQNYIDKKRIFNSVRNLTIVSVSNWLNNVVGQSFLSAVPREVIYNGVDTELFKPNNNTLRDKYNIGNQFMILGVATTWDRRKGLDDFVQLSDKLKDNGTIIVLVGLSITQVNKLPSNIIGIQRTENQKELSGLYSSADLFMNLSVEETFGLTTAEALSCGTPALVYDATACPELVNENTGFVVKKNDISALVNVIDRVKSNGKLSYTHSCRNRAIALFNKKDCYLEYFELYKRLLKNEYEKI